jgi:hypothetical protein
MQPADIHYLSSPRESVLIDVAESELEQDDNLYQSLGIDALGDHVRAAMLDDGKKFNI